MLPIRMYTKKHMKWRSFIPLSLIASTMLISSSSKLELKELVMLEVEVVKFPYFKPDLNSDPLF